MRLRWSLLAIERIAEVAEYIARDDPAAAQRWVEETFSRVGQLERFPDSGRRAYLRVKMKVLIGYPQF